MNKIEQMHYSSIVKIYLDAFKVGGNARMDCEKAASKSAEITEQIALEFYEWADTSEEADNFWRNNKVSIDMDGSHNDIIKENRRKLFQLFLKTKQ